MILRFTSHNRNQGFSMGKKTIELLPMIDPKTCHSAIGEILEYIHERYYENISFCALANKLHFSKNYLSCLFHRETGQNFRNYLMQCRIRHALALLDSGNFKIKEVALQTGFCDPAYFSRIFKSFVGVSPTQYVTFGLSAKDFEGATR